MKFVSAGHCNVQGPNYDPGAVGIGGRKEADETVKIRDAVVSALRERGHTDIVTDLNTESLREYLHRVKPGNASVVVEFHLDASSSSLSGGASAIVGEDADRLDKAFAAEMAAITSSMLGVKNRGVITEAQSHRGRLGLMREQGIVTLVEVCFVTSESDLRKLDLGRERLAHAYAEIIAKYDDLLK